MIACLIVGYIVKMYVADVDNKYIPTIVCILGAVLGVVRGGFALEVIVGGALSGLASTGLYEMLRNWINKAGGNQ